MITTRKYRNSDKFNKSCKCDQHNENKSKVFNVNSRKCSRDMVERLIKSGIFTRNRSYICQECLEMYGLRKKNRSKTEKIDKTEEMEMDAPVAIDALTEVNTSEQVNDTENVNEIGTSDAEPSTKVITSSENSKEEKEKESAKS